MYQPLKDSEKQIRLLRLLPGAKDEPIRLELEMFDRDEAPDYLAISYVWGTDADEEAVIIDGVARTVRKNCAYTLWQARLHYSDEWVWIDSVCIDQTDLNEKSHQVRRMGNVYASAKLTLICVGPGTEDVDEILAWVPDLEVVTLHSLILLTGPQPEMGAESHRMMRLAKEVWKAKSVGSFNNATRHFANRPYWKRLWVVQEIALSREIVVLCGDRKVTWRFVTNLWKFDDVRDEHPWPEPWFLSGDLTPLHTLEDILKRRDISTAYDCLESLTHLECLDPRDRVYGTLGILKWRAEGVQPIYPDYERNAAELAIMLLETGSIDHTYYQSLIPMLAIDGCNERIRQLVKHNRSRIASDQDASPAQGRDILARMTKLHLAGSSSDLAANYMSECQTPVQYEELIRKYQVSFASTQGSLTDLLLQELYKQKPHKVRASTGRVAALVCQNARAGDYLAEINDNTVPGYGCCLVLRHKNDLAYEIVGQAVLIGYNVSKPDEYKPGELSICTSDLLMFLTQDRMPDPGLDLSRELAFCPRARLERLLTRVNGSVQFYSAFDPSLDLKPAISEAEEAASGHFRSLRPDSEAGHPPNIMDIIGA